MSLILSRSGVHLQLFIEEVYLCLQAEGVLVVLISIRARGILPWTWHLPYVFHFVIKCLLS